MNFFSKNIKKKKITSYICVFFALLTLAISISYLVILQPIKEYVDYIVFGLLLSSAMVFMVSFVFNLDRFGAAIMACLDFAAFIYYIITIYNYPITQLMEIPELFNIPYIKEIIALAVLMLVASIGSNVLARTKMIKFDSLNIEENK